MNPPAQFSHLRLWLYLGANCLPAVVKWATLSWDTTPRGLTVLALETLATGCITTRAYLDGKTTDKVVAESITTQPKGTPEAKGPTETKITAPEELKS